MARGRRPKLDPPVEVRINIPASVTTKVNLFLVDPLTGKPRYGARSELITQLLRDWLALQMQLRGKATGQIEDQS